MIITGKTQLNEENPRSTGSTGSTVANSSESPLAPTRRWRSRRSCFAHCSSSLSGHDLLPHMFARSDAGILRTIGERERARPQSSPSACIPSVSSAQREVTRDSCKPRHPPISRHG